MRVRRSIGPLGAAAFALVLSAGLAGCQAVKDVQDAMEGRTPESEGGGSYASKGPNLSVPPDYTLRPPVGGGSSNDTKAASQAARARVFNTPAAAQSPPPGAGGYSAGERAFLKKLENSAGVQADPQVRQRIDQETQSTGEQEKQLVDKLLTWREAPSGKAAVAGQGVTEKPAEDSTVVIRKKRGLLESIF
ncbi:MAG: DUF3035 domain-containing protein [Alphaproteobacteria bacterium]